MKVNYVWLAWEAFKDWIGNNVWWRKMMRVANEAHKSVQTKPVNMSPLDNCNH